MTTKTILLWRIWLAVSAAFVVAGCTGSGQGQSDTPRVPEYPPSQQAFHALNKSCLGAYDQGQNEIQKSLAFNNCNQQRTQFAAQHGGIVGWTGTISDISTDQGADVVTVSIEAEVDGFEIKFGTVNNRFSDMLSNSMITPNNPLFNVLAQMKEGDKVTFSADFLGDPEGKTGVWEGSMTERGSMSEPEFQVKFSDIRPFEPGAVAATPTTDPRIATATRAGPQSSQVAPDHDEPCNDPNSYLTPRGVDEVAIAQFQLDCPGYDLPTQWQRTGIGGSPGAQTIDPSFDCTKATSSAERLICSDEQLASLDAELAKLYSEIYAKAPNRGWLKEGQRQWLREIRDTCADVDCLIVVHKDRIRWLHSIGEIANGESMVGSKSVNGTFLFREEIDGGYWNDWHATSDDAVGGEVRLEVMGEGKTAGFGGTLVIDCASHASHWENLDANGWTAVEEIPSTVIQNATRLFCNDSH